MSFNCGMQEMFMKSLPSIDQVNFYLWLHLSVFALLLLLCGFGSPVWGCFFFIFPSNRSCLKRMCVSFSSAAAFLGSSEVSQRDFLQTI